jgi:hypothetical protein
MGSSTSEGHTPPLRMIARGRSPYGIAVYSRADIVDIVSNQGSRAHGPRMQTDKTQCCFSRSRNPSTTNSPEDDRPRHHLQHHSAHTQCPVDPNICIRGKSASWLTWRSRQPGHSEPHPYSILASFWLFLMFPVGLSLAGLWSGVAIFPYQYTSYQPEPSPCPLQHRRQGSVTLRLPVARSPRFLSAPPLHLLSHRRSPFMFTTKHPCCVHAS